DARPTSMPAPPPMPMRTSLEDPVALAGTLPSQPNLQPAVTPKPAVVPQPAAARRRVLPYVAVSALLITAVVLARLWLQQPSAAPAPHPPASPVHPQPRSALTPTPAATTPDPNPPAASVQPEAAAAEPAPEKQPAEPAATAREGAPVRPKRTARLPAAPATAA